MQSLVVTPAPHATESLWGYLTRVAEANGYDSARAVIKHAGMTSAEQKTMLFPVSKLEQVMGFDSGKLAQLSNTGRVVHGIPRLRVLGHESEFWYRQNFVRRYHPAFCPQCVAQDGFLDAFWDISLVVACPEHRCLLISSCPACGEELSWFRRGLLTCRCGASLNVKPSWDVDGVVVDLMHVLRNTLHRHTDKTFKNTAGFPVKELQNAPLWALLWLITRLAQHNQESHGLPVSNAPMDVAKYAADVLKNWPHGYRSLLQRIGDKTGSRGLSVVGINARFKDFHDSLFKAKPYGNQFGFLLDEYTRFGLIEWGESVVDDRSVRDGTEREKRYFSKAALARYLGVTTTTTDKWVQQGLLTVRTVTTAKNKRYIADAEAVLLPRRAEGKSIKVRDAAKFLGLPLKVLHALRKSGHYEVRHMPTRMLAYHEKDLQHFKNMLMRPVQKMLAAPQHNRHVISFKDVMTKLKFGSPDKKVDFVVRYLNGSINAVGRGSDSVEDIYFERAMVMEATNAGRIAAADGGMTVRQVAQFLQCREICVPGLVSAGYLLQRHSASSTRILKTSVDSFAARFCALRSIAAEHQINAIRLASVAEKSGLNLLSIACTHGGHSFFLPRADKAKLLRKIKLAEAKR